MRNKYSCILVVRITRVIMLALFVVLPYISSAQQSPSIQSGVSFQWSDTQANLNQPATIQSVTIDGTIYNTFVVPTSYEMTRLGPDGHSPNRIRLNGGNFGGNSNSPNWNTNAINAFQDKNLNHYFTAIPNGRNICSDFDAANTTDAQEQTIFYNPAIPSNEGGVLAVTERGGNNCYYIEVYGTPVGGGAEQLLGKTFIRNVGDYRNCTFAPPVPGSDYWQSGRCNENGQTIGISLFYLNDIAPTGSKITKIEFVGASRDHGDGKFFILQKYAVDQQNINCIDTKYSGDLNVDNNVPENSTYSLVSGPTPAGQSFTLNSDGTYSYTPIDGFTGDVVFEFEVCLPTPNTTVCDIATATINFVQLPPETEASVSCGSNTDDFTISVASPLGPEYEYSIDGITYQSSPDFSNLPEGSYTISIRSTFTMCESMDTIPIVLENIELTPIITDVLCNGGASGAINLSITGGIAPYDVLWNNGSTNLNLTDLAAGSYDVTVTDARGCTATSSVIITQPDDALTANISSTTNALCADDTNGSITVNASGGTPPYNYSIDNGATIQSSGLFENLPAGSYTIQITDANDCTINISATIETEDEETPEITVPATIIIEGCDTSYITDTTAIFPFRATQSSDIQAIFDSNPEYNASDDFNIESITYIDEITSTNNCPITVLRTFTITDNCNNSATATQTITVQDTTPPTFTAPANLNLECDANIEDLNITGDVTDEADNCATDLEAIYKDIISEGSCPNSYIINRKWTLIDNCDNVATALQIIRINDTTAPTFSVPENITIECDVDATDLTITGDVTDEADNCDTDLDAVFTDTIADGNCENAYIITREWSLTDLCDNTTTLIQTITVVDTTPPTFTAPANLNLECGTNVDDLSITGDVTDEADNCATDLDAIYKDIIIEGNCPNSYIINRKWTLIDNCDNVASALQVIRINDTTAPTFSVPEDITVECDTDVTDLTLTGDVTDEADNCTTDLEATYTDTIVQGSCPNESVITRTWSLTDECDNTTVLVQTISIEDTTPPTLSIPNDITIECGEDESSINTGTASGNDTCGEVTISESDTVITACGNTKTIIRTWTATDDCGNATTLDQTISIEDNTPPIIDNSAIENIDIQCGITPDGALEAWLSNNAGATAIDACGSLTWTNDYDANTNVNCADGGTTITFIVTDDCGNATNTTATYSITDTINPILTVPDDITIECGDNSDPTNTGAASATDDCATPNITYSDTEVTTCGNTKTITRIWIATDDCGNSTSLDQTISIEDNTAPIFNETLPADMTVECDAIPMAETLTANDSCSNNTDVIYQEITTQGACIGDFIIERTWSVTDDCENTAVHTQIITVEDNTAPTLVTPYDETITIACNDSIPPVPDLVFEDSCSSDITVAFDEISTQVNNFDDYDIIRTWTLTDDCGNETQFTQTITVEINNVISATDANRCVLDIEFDLFNLLSGDFDMNGTWTVVSGNATINGSLFDPSTVEVGEYTFKYAITEGSCPTEIDVIVTIDDDCVVLPCGNEDDVVIAKTVTANGDNVNDVFTIGGIDDCGFVIELQIFNRWGAEIYKNNNYQNDWNGDAHGSSVGSSGKVPTGTYYYIINLRNSGLKPFAGPIYVATNK